MSNNNGGRATATAKGIGVCGLLGVAFVVLKLCGVIEWSWIWVLAPFWGSFLLGILAFVLFLIFITRITK